MLIRSGLLASVVFAQASLAQEVMLDIHQTSSPNDDQFCWAPVVASARLAGAAAEDVRIRLTSRGSTPATEARVVFQAGPRPAQGDFAPSDELELVLPKSGEPVAFTVAGKWTPAMASSREPGDVLIEAHRGGAIVATAPVTIRVRKNAETLSAEERDRLLGAMRRLHEEGWFNRYAEIHDLVGNVAHSFGPVRYAFLSWHRAFMLDFERRLQAIDPSVALPYWKFDEGAPTLFSAAFLGEIPDDSPSATVQFTAANPLTAPETVLGVDFGSFGQGELLRGETRSLKLEGPYPAPPTLPFTSYAAATSGIEFGYHGTAHVAVGGFLGDPATAAVDPLFFLLHANVDRAWATWQRKQASHFDASVDIGLYPRGAFNANCCQPRQPRTAFGDEVLWPWNPGASANGVPGWARDPGQASVRLAFPHVTQFGPSAEPLAREMVDYMDVQGDGGALGFCYDDLRF